MKKSKNIYQVCPPCGFTANALTCLKKYGKLPLQYKSSVSTFHEGICDCCGHEMPITEVRDFYYPDFDLIPKVAKLLKSKV